MQDSKVRQLAPAPTLDAPEELTAVDQKETAGQATIARINFVSAEACQQLDGLSAEVSAIKQLVLQDADQVKRAIELLVESGKTAAEYTHEVKQKLTDLRSRRAKLVVGA